MPGLANSVVVQFLGKEGFAPNSTTVPAAEPGTELERAQTGASEAYAIALAQQDQKQQMHDQQQQQPQQLCQQQQRKQQEASQGTLALFSDDSSAGKPVQQPVLSINIKDDVFKPLLEACTWDQATRTWLTPPTSSDERLGNMDWRKMLDLPHGWTPTSFVPTFFEKESDPNRGDKPRLDVVISFSNLESVRYHPGAAPIWSQTPQPTEAMRIRYNRAKNLAKQTGSAAI